MKLHGVLLAFLLALAPVAAQAQSTVLQAGPFVSGHTSMYSGSGGSQPIVIDSGTAAGGGAGVGLKELGLTVRGTGTAPYANAGTGPLGENVCDYDAPITNATGGHVLCWSPNAQGGGLISYNSFGTATPLPLAFNVNGVGYEFPFSIGGVVGPSTSMVNDAACWNNTTGTLLKDCGAFVTVGGNNTWTGTNNFTGPLQIGGTVETFPASGNIVGTSDAQTLTNKSINASQINSGTLPATVMPALTGDVTSSAGTVATTIANNVVTNAKLATATQNTVKGAATSTAVADLAVPSCSSANNALQWTTNTGFSCATVTATTAGFGINLTGGVFSISQAQPPYGYDMPVNLGITASVGGSNLTLNVVGANGSAPSATNPVMIPFRSTTLATGTPVWSSLTSALSIVVPSGATLASSSNVPFRIWIFAEYNGGTPELGVAICSSTTTIFPCSAWETTRITTTTITGLSTSAGTLYSTTGVSNDSVRIIGYADYSSGLTTAGLYASTPTTLQLMGPGSWKPGDVVQHVTQLFSSTTTSSSASNVVTGSTASITPTSSINPVSIQVNGTGGQPSSGAITSQIFRAAGGSAACTTALGSIAQIQGAGGTTAPISMGGFDAPKSASQQTYTVCVKMSAAASGTWCPLSGCTMDMIEVMGFRDPEEYDAPLDFVG